MVGGVISPLCLPGSRHPGATGTCELCGGQFQCFDMSIPDWPPVAVTESEAAPGPFSLQPTLAKEL